MMNRLIDNVIFDTEEFSMAGYSNDRLNAISFAYGIVEFDVNAVITSANNVFSRILGYQEGELAGKSHCVLLTPEQTESHDDWWSAVLSGDIVSDEFIRINKNGESVWIQASYTRIIDKNENITGVIKIATDITNKKQLQAEHLSYLRAIERSLGVIEFDINGTILRVNQIYQQLTGYKTEELVGKHHSILCHSSYSSSEEYLTFWSQLNSGESISGRFSRLSQSGDTFLIHATYSPIFSPDGKVMRIIKYAHDITEQIKIEKTVAKQQDLLNLILDSHRLFIKNHDLSIACNSIFERLLDITECSLCFIGLVNSLTDTFDIFIHSTPTISLRGKTQYRYNDKERRDDDLFAEILINNVVVCINNAIDNFNGLELPGETPKLESFLGIPINHNGDVIGMIAVAKKSGYLNEETVTFLEPLVSALGTLIHARKLEDERQRAEAILRFDSQHDSLTFLPNRNFFFERANRLIKLIEQNKEDGRDCALAIVDIDFFKKINDMSGHLAGDAVLKDLSKILVRSLRKNDIVARLGGEEFIVLLRNVTTSQAYRAMERIRKNVEKHNFKYMSSNINVTISIGLAQHEACYSSVDDWIEVVDKKLYEAKKSGRNRLIQ